MKMHVRILLLLCAYINLIKSDSYDSDEAKYIDLLPEQEKREFLDRIARRIIAEIRTRKTAEKTSVEISDERLNEHAAYVKKIMDEESENIKTGQRIDDYFKSEHTEDDDLDDVKVKPLQKNGLKDQDTLDNIDLSEKKVRIKKGTPDDKNSPKGKIIKEKEVVSVIPVQLLYNDEINLQNTVTSRNNDITEDVINNNKDIQVLPFGGLELSKLGNNNQDSSEKNSKKSKKIIINLNKETKERESEDENMKIIQRTNTDINEDTEDTSVKSQTIINDFEPQQDEFEEYKNDTTERTSEKVTLYRPLVPDNVSERPVEKKNFENSTENSLETSSVLNFIKEVPKDDEESILGTTKAALKDFEASLETNPAGMVNVDLNNSQPLLGIKGQLGGNKLEKVDTISPNKSIEYDVKVTETFLQPATSVGDVHLALNSSFVTMDNIDDTTNKNRLVSKEEKYKGRSGDYVLIESTEVDTSTNPVLRVRQKDWRDNTNQHRFKKNPDSFKSNDNRNINRFENFEDQGNKPPTVSSKQIYTDVDGEQYYVPVYNFAPNNAFYSAYNRFGPNFLKNGHLLKNSNPYYYNNMINYGVDKFNFEPKYGRTQSNKKNGSVKNRGQRKFKHYRNGEMYQKQKSYQNNFLPVLKERLINIDFNPNDYLDMDYYLGRVNDSPELMYNLQNGEIPYAQEDSEEVIDPAPRQSYNIKNTISNIRKKVNLQKLTDKNKNDKLKENQKITDKVLAHPLFRVLNNNLVIFLPRTRTKNSATQHSKEKNIAVDYYFSRMSSGEWPFFEDDVSEVSSINQKAKFKSSDITDHVGKHIFKTDTEGEHRVMQEKQFQIPLKLDNVLKIDLAMKDNKSKVIFRKVKNTIKKDVDILLNAHLNVLKDMVEYDNEGLLHFDWLGSTVDVQSALKKLISLANIMHVRDDVHRSDKELFRYVLFLFKSALKTLIEAEEFSATNDGIHKTYQRLSKRKTLMPIINTKQFEAWREVKKYMREMRNLNIDIYDYLLNQFEYFLIGLSDNLTELHETIKEIAVVTKFNRQRWYQDLKDLYLSPMNKKVSLSLLLHLASSRLFGLIEESAKNGVEENLINYVRTHKMEVERTREEFVFVLRLLKEINRLKN